MDHPFGALTIKQGLIAAARTSSGNGTGVDLKGAEGEVLVTLAVGTVTGTNPTGDFIVADSADNSSFTAVTGGAFTQVTATPGTANAVSTIVLQARALRRYVRIEFTIGGTSTPTFPSSVLFAFRTKDI